MTPEQDSKSVDNCNLRRKHKVGCLITILAFQERLVVPKTYWRN